LCNYEGVVEVPALDKKDTHNMTCSTPI